MTTNKRVRAWCFTLNNWTEEEREQVDKMKCRYMVYGYETCPTTGTPHLQGYFELENGRTLISLKKELPRANLGERRLSAEIASNYCKKEGNFVERGEISNQGKRTDLENLVDDIKLPVSELAEKYPTTFIKFSKGIIALRDAQMKDRTEKPIVSWIWGLAGVGKTRFCVEKHLDSHYIKDGTQWWNNYNQEDAIIIDDFDGRWPFRDLLRLLDRYKYSGQTKGGYVKVNSKHIYITCEFPPEKYWKDNELAQVTRRLNSCVKLGTEESSTEVAGNTGSHSPGIEPVLFD